MFSLLFHKQDATSRIPKLPNTRGSSGVFVGVNNPNTPPPDVVEEIIRGSKAQQVALQKRMRSEKFKLSYDEIAKRARDYSMKRGVAEATNWQNDPVLRTTSTQDMIKAYYRQKWEQIHENRRRKFRELIELQGSAVPEGEVDRMVGTAPPSTPLTTPYDTGVSMPSSASSSPSIPEDDSDFFEASAAPVVAKTPVKTPGKKRASKKKPEKTPDKAVDTYKSSIKKQRRRSSRKRRKPTRLGSK